ncbi:hypothetical protein B3C1_14273 [Gallaecimonas xiamenensis 3-C-1]|uniref:Uncharacterized protein n=1 Tax=Gallaecimonas xiamenensis 3-C-1 TaxID=745411 RepID=K2JYG8_9GAMM|nr:hypothetical protein B3C1_14273 [Gallaecimonas xiamenensis 3-C-1]
MATISHAIQTRIRGYLTFMLTMTNLIKRLLLLPFLCLSLSSMATESMNSGYIKGLSYRSGWVTFRVVDGAGINQCEPCPTDPGALGTGRCWIPEQRAAQLSLLLSALAMGKKINGRVYAKESNCEIYQMSIED